ncbi:MAG: hypothetical protein IJB96_03730, partial [Lachnospira sp.]|nr:hypothetical protein [Lachnospira sp.]
VYLFIFLNLAYMSILGMKRGEPFEAMFRVLFPYDVVREEYDGMMLIINVALYMIIVSLPVKRVDEQLALNPYILTRTTRIRALGMQAGNVFRVIVRVMLIKFLVDIIWSCPLGLKNVEYAMLLELSTALSICLWALPIYLLSFMYVQPKYRYFIVIVMVAVSQFMSAYYEVFSVMVPGSPAISATPWYWIGIKAAVLFVGVCILIFVSLRYECIDDY